jgi:EmrB/QacA subfamily drug resistance transporter
MSRSDVSGAGDAARGGAAAVAVKPACLGEPHPRRWLLLPIILAGAMLGPIDFFIVNVALPTIQTGLSMSAAQVQFVVAAYTVAYAVLLTIGGRLGDLYGRKRMYLTGMVGFGVASALCGLAPNAEVLIFGRAVQGVMAAIMAPQVLAMIHTIFPLAERPRALGIFAAVFGFAAIVGQLAGGFLVALHPAGLTWQAIFLVNLPICAPVVVAAAFLLPDHRPARGVKPDVPGILMLTLTLLLLVYPAVEGREAGWPAWSFIALACVLPSLAIFVQVERWQLACGRAPLVDLRLFANPRFVLGLTIGLLFYASAVFFLTYALYLQDGLGWTALSASLAILPFGFGFFLGPFATPALLRRWGPAVVLNFGFGLMAIGNFGSFASTLVTGTPGPLFYVGLFFAGLGQGFVLPSLLRVVLHEASAEHAGLAAGLVNSILQIGSALSISIIGGVFFSVLGPQPDTPHYTQAFAASLACIAADNLLCFGLAFFLRQGRMATKTQFEEAKANSGT